MFQLYSHHKATNARWEWGTGRTLAVRTLSNIHFTYCIYIKHNIIVLLQQLYHTLFTKGCTTSYALRMMRLPDVDTRRIFCILRSFPRSWLIAIIRGYPATYRSTCALVTSPQQIFIHKTRKYNVILFEMHFLPSFFHLH
jgi:hypothetical protein